MSPSPPFPAPFPATPALEVADLRAGYGPINVLEGLSIRVDPGEIVALIGANGAGKSTLLMTVSGIVPARGGTIRLFGQPIDGTAPHQIARAGMAHVPEGRRIFPRLTVEENLRLGAELAPPAHWAHNRERMFQLFPRLAERRQQRGGTLSGGEQQMLAVARALVGEPRLLLLDEPSLGLAPLVVTQILEALQELNRTTGLPILLVEQNALKALRLAHRAYVLERGRIALEGTGQALLDDPQVRDAYLGAGMAKQAVAAAAS